MTTTTTTQETTPRIANNVTFARLSVMGNVGTVQAPRTTAKGTNILNFSVAVNQRNGTTLWLDGILFGRVSLYDYITTGRLLYLEGPLSQYSYEKGGQQHTGYRFKVQKIRFLTRGPDAPQQEDFANHAAELGEDLQLVTEVVQEIS